MPVPQLPAKHGLPAHSEPLDHLNYSRPAPFEASRATLAAEES